jgi:hypothetical protein
MPTPTILNPSNPQVQSNYQAQGSESSPQIANVLPGGVPQPGPFLPQYNAKTNNASKAQKAGKSKPKSAALANIQETNRSLSDGLDSSLKQPYYELNREPIKVAAMLIFKLVETMAILAIELTSPTLAKALNLEKLADGHDHKHDHKHHHYGQHESEEQQRQAAIQADLAAQQQSQSINNIVNRFRI